MTLGGIRLRVHPLMPLALALTYMLSGGQALVPTLIALGLHESAHLLTALKTRARVDEIELMPFGAAIRLYELWELSTKKLILISLSGPLINLLTGAAFTTLIYLFPGFMPALVPLVRASLTLALVNLIPALPLDGGRIFCALLSIKRPRTRSVRVGIWAGKLLSAALVAGAILYLIRFHRLPLGLILAAVYIFTSGERERQQCEGASLRMLLAADAPARTPVPVKWLLVRPEDTLLSASRLMESGSAYLFAVADDTGAFRGAITQQALNLRLRENASARFADFDRS